jgi:uncharacterized membrane protein
MAPSFERSIHSMGTVYTLFKFLHIVGAIVWIGGVISVNIISVRIAREKDGAALAAMSRQSRFYGMAIIGPAAGLTLLAGIVMIAVSGLSIPLWVAWGLAAILVSMGLGATLIRRAGEELSQLAATATPGVAPERVATAAVDAEYRQRARAALRRVGHGVQADFVTTKGPRRTRTRRA